MITPATYAMLAPALFEMLELEEDAADIQLRRLLLLYPERLLFGLDSYLQFQIECSAQMASYVGEHNAPLNRLGLLVTQNNALRQNMGAALGAALLKLSRHDALRMKYLEVLNYLNEKSMAERLLLMIALVCAYLPDLQEPYDELFNKDFNELLQAAAPHLQKLMGMTSKRV